MATELDPVTRQVDAALSALSSRVDLLLDVTPVNAEEAWEASRRAGHGADLALRYRPDTARTDVAAVRRDLAEVPIGAVGHEALRELLAGVADELRDQLRLVEAVGGPDALARSLDLWGTADDALLALALDLLARLEPSPPPEALVAPAAFATRAAAELDRYREQDPDLRAAVAVRDDVPSLMVVQRQVVVGTDSWIPAHRQEALVHHEVGVHLLTAATGGRQPLGLLEHGLAGHEETQEALGVLAEHLVDGLDADRVRTLAGRVVAVRRLTDGGRFPALFGELHEEHGFDARAAFAIALRVVRAGGLTKDVIYLRGVVALVEHLAAGGDLDTLLLGKLHLDHVGLLEELRADGVLRPAHLRPRWLEVDGAADRLAALRAGTTSVADWP